MGIAGIKKITPEQGREIIESRQPRGAFYFRERNGVVIGVDNWHGDAWTEEFGYDTRSCIRWLMNRELEADECRPCSSTEPASASALADT